MTKAAPAPDNSEWLTRKKLVDKDLQAAGWRVTRYDQRPLASFDGCAVEEYPTANGPADYPMGSSWRFGIPIPASLDAFWARPPENRA